MIMKRLLKFASFLFLIPFLFFGSCQKAEKKTAKNILRTVLMTDPPSLDPRMGPDAISAGITYNLFIGLTYTGKNGDTELGLAHSFQVSEDQKTYTFFLKHSKWSDGSPLTAFDFEQTWKELLQPNFPAASVNLFYLIKNAQKAKRGEVPVDEVGIRAVNDRTLVVELENPTSYFPEALTHRAFYPMHASMRGKILEIGDIQPSSYVCCGAFKLKDYKFQNELLLEKNPYYFEAKEVALDGIHFSIVRDQHTAFLMFEKGELDWMGSPICELPRDVLPKLKKTKKLEVSPAAGTWMLMFNTNQFPFNNANLRRALSLAIDRKALVKNITQLDDPIALSLVPPIQKKSNWHALFEEHNIKKARELFEMGLKELGIKASDLNEVTIAYNSSDLWNKVVQAIQQQWYEAFGVTFKLNCADWKIHLDRLSKGDFQIGRYGWTCQFNDESNLLELFKYKNHYNNYTRWENSEFVSYMNAANSANSNEKRSQLLEAAEAVFIREMPIAPLFHLNSAYVKQPYVQGVYVSPVVNIDFRFAHLDRQ
jgi:oligopeptide transport system substrate-binding protein